MYVTIVTLKLILIVIVLLTIAIAYYIRYQWLRFEFGPKVFGEKKIAEIHTIKVDNYSYFSYELCLDVVLSRKEYTFSV